MNIVPPPTPGPQPPADIVSRFREALAEDEVRAMELLFGLRAACQQLDNSVLSWLGADALTPGRFQVMVVLWSADGPIPQKHIVATLKVARATVSELLEVLARDGLVTLVPDPGDRRQVLAQLTTTGAEVARQTIESNAKRLRTTLEALSGEDQADLVRLLSRLRQCLDPARSGS